MKALFNIDGLFFKKLYQIIDMIILNCFFLVTSLPIITIGVSWSALLSVFLNRNKGNGESISTLYFRTFKSNLKQGIKLTLNNIILLFVIFGLSKYFLIATPILKLFIGVILVIIIWSFFIIMTYGYLYIARYHDNLFNTIKNCFLFFTLKPFQTFLIIFVNLIIIYFIVFSYEGIITALYVLTFFGFSLWAYCNVNLSKKVMDYVESKNYKE